jgi:hypothetical protein
VAKGISLHVGLNSVDPGQYEGWAGPLGACEADAQDMHALARSHGYEATLLKTSTGTRKAVLAGIQAAAGKLKSGDIFFLTYSGHGGQVPDRDGDEPEDMADETWCLYDGELIDDELAALWTTFKPGVRILVLSDSCHSGTVTRVALSTPANATARAAFQEMGVHEEVRFRAMPTDVALRTYRAHAAFYDGLQVRKGRKKGMKAAKPVAKASVRLVSGCQDNQLSSDGTFNGLFTGTLLRVWNVGKFKGDYAAFHRDIVKRMPPTQTPNHFVIGAKNPKFDAQKPFTV